MMELCVVCQKPTGYTFETPIELRNEYVDGLGQLCPLCWCRWKVPVATRYDVEEERRNARCYASLNR